jgi:hypothetical protein
LFKKILGAKLGKLENYWKSQLVINPKKKSQTLKKTKQTNKQSKAHTYMCLEEELERIYVLVGDDDGQRKQPFHGS